MPRKTQKAIWSYIKSKSKTREGIGDLHTNTEDTNSGKTEDKKEKANILSDYFARVYRTVGLSHCRTIGPSDYRTVGLSDCRIIGRTPFFACDLLPFLNIALICAFFHSFGSVLERESQYLIWLLCSCLHKWAPWGAATNDTNWNSERAKGSSH
jgi:hypothetical protein